MKYQAPFVARKRSQLGQALFAVIIAMAGLVPSAGHAQTCLPPASGLVSWWPGNGSTADVAGGNNGTFVGSVAYTTGEAGQAFSFNGSGEGVTVGNPAALQLQTFTIDAWIQRGSTTKASVTTGGGLIFSYGSAGYGFGLNDSGTLLLSQIGESEVTSTVVITNTTWHHVAVSKSGSAVIFYLDGVAYPVGSAYSPTFAFTTSAAIGLVGGGTANGFLGSIDEVDVFNRALAASEVQAIYNAGSAGKCTSSPPVITTQPMNQTVVAGQNAIFSVAVSGLGPMSYSWQLGGSLISGATSSSLILNNAQAVNAGNYTVTAANAYGSATSLTVSLTVNPAACVPPASGLAGWWAGNGDTVDSANGNNGTLHGSVAYVAGEVGQAFSFNGNGEGVSIGNPTVLQVQTFTIDAWIQRTSLTQASLTAGGGNIFAYGAGGYGFGLNDNGQMYLSQVSGSQDLSGVFITDMLWHHVAVAKNGNSVVFYLDGVASATSTFTPAFTFTNSAAIGARGDVFTNSFLGAVDEVDVFNRALAASEVQAIYNAASAGKCASSPPVIITQPVSQTVTVGNNASFSIVVAGAGPLIYQWQLNSVAISGATTSTLILPDVQIANAGNYAITVNNAYGTVTSSTVSLSVNPAVCVPPASGLVSWWPGDASALDAVGVNNGTLQGNVTYVAGLVGQAFSFSGSGEAVTVGSAPALQLQTFTIDAWVQRASLTQASLSAGGGMIFSYGAGGYGFALGDNGQLLLSQITASVVGSSVFITDMLWHHVAVTRSGSSVVFYLDGVANAAASYNPNFTFTTPAAVGARGDNYANSFLGSLDEVDVFNRVLAASEVQAIYNAVSAGKCLPVVTTSITTQPVSQTVTVGNNASFSVVASGTPPLNYQWQFNNANISGATASTLSLVDAQSANAGNYSVVVTGVYGSVTSSTVSLTVNPVVCIAPASGLVSWWPGNGNTADVEGGNSGTFHGNVTYVAGQVGQAFSFNGNSEAVAVGSAPALQLPTFTIDAWIQRASLTQASLTAGGGNIFAYGAGGYGFGLNDNGQIYLSQIAGSQALSGIFVTDMLWHHVAAAKSGSSVVFYLDGVASATIAFSPTFTFTTTAAVGARGDNFANSFLGSIDEVDVFNRALATSEVQSIYNASSAGKCLPTIPPSITTQPVNQTVTAGNNANFSVVAAGTPPLSYQWQFNNANISGATTSTLPLANAQSANAGNYSVIVSSANGSVTSSTVSLTVNPAVCITPASGLVSWWPGNGNAVDIEGGNGGTLQGSVTYVAGQVGQAFSFSGSGEAVKVGSAPALQLQTFTIDAWVQRASLTQASLTAGGGMIFSYGAGGYGFALGDNGQLLLSQIATSVVGSSVFITDMLWHHVAVTKSGSSVVFYLDGVANPVSAYNATFTFGTAAAVGARGDNFANGFLGSLDEVDVFNRALVVSEVQAIYNAASAGKCLPTIPPSITTQPINETVTAGNNANFSVVATGTPPLNYQWQFNSANISGATGSTFSLANAQSANAGNYSVIVSSADGSITSSTASLTVNPVVCVTPPSGLVSWWPGNGNAVDFEGANSGTLQGNVTYVAGQVGQAFSFSGSGEAVALGSAPALQLQTFTIDAWVQRASLTQGSLSAGGGMIFSYGAGGYGFAVGDNGQLLLSQIAVSVVGSSVFITDMLWHHVAVTRSGSSVVFYLDGVANAAASYNPNFTFGTSAAVGARGDNFANSFLGSLDEVDVFNRVLAASEVQAIYNAASAGKCSTFPPTIITQPVSQTVAVGNNASFSVTAGGTAPLSYQWQFNNANISGATTSTLSLVNAQSANAGNYSVVVSSAYGSVTSASANLAVLTGGCTTAPAGLVSWWPGNGNAVDIADNINGTLVGNVTFGTGEVGQAFNFSGSGTAVTLGNPTALQLQNFTIEAWIQLASVSASADQDILAYGNGGYIFGIRSTGTPFLSKAGTDLLTSSYAFTDTAWHHLAVTKNGTSVVFYVDGVAYPAPAYSTSYTFSTSVAIGAKGDNLSGNFAGKIDELSIYSTALTTAQVQAIYAAASAGKCSDVSAHDHHPTGQSDRCGGQQCQLQRNRRRHRALELPVAIQQCQHQWRHRFDPQPGQCPVGQCRQLFSCSEQRLRLCRQCQRQFGGTYRWLHHATRRSGQLVAGQWQCG